MALKGWRLKSISLGWILKYERIEPKKLYYSVDFIGRRKKDFDEKEKKDLFTEFHWNYVCSNWLFTVYVSESGVSSLSGENTSIYKRNSAPIYLGGLFLLFLITAGLSVWIVKQNYLEIVANTYFLLIPAVVAAFFAKAVIGTVYYLLWRKRRKAQKSTHNTPLHRWVKDLVSLIPYEIVLAALIFCITDAIAAGDYINLKFYSPFLIIGFFLLYFALIVIRSILKRETSIKAVIILIVTVIVSIYLSTTFDYYEYKDEYSDYELAMEGVYYAKLYRDKLPLTMADFDITAGQYRSGEFIRHRNALISYDYYQDRSVDHLYEQQVKSVCYEVVTCKYDLFIDGYINWELQKEGKFTRTDNPAWGAKAVYEERLYPYRKAAVYDDKVIIIYNLEEIETEQIDIIKEKLL
jgi:uncharacterized membrane protein